MSTYENIKVAVILFSENESDLPISKNELKKLFWFATWGTNLLLDDIMIKKMVLLLSHA